MTKQDFAAQSNNLLVKVVEAGNKTVDECNTYLWYQGVCLSFDATITDEQYNNALLAGSLDYIGAKYGGVHINQAKLLQDLLPVLQIFQLFKGHSGTNISSLVNLFSVL